MNAAYQRMQYPPGLESYSYDGGPREDVVANDYWRARTGFGTSSTSGAKSSGWTSTLVLAGAIGIGVVGYLIYRQVHVSAGAVRGAKRVFIGEGA